VRRAFAEEVLLVGATADTCVAFGEEVGDGGEMDGAVEERDVITREESAAGLVSGRREGTRNR
jgi:hypothetical protein